MVWSVAYLSLDHTNGSLLTIPQADPTIPFRGTRRYYDAVQSRDPSVHNYYRLFESPGLAHCYGGPGAYPSGLFDSLVKWVEKGEVLDKVEVFLPADKTGHKEQMLPCPYPRPGTAYPGQYAPRGYADDECSN